MRNKKSQVILPSFGKLRGGNYTVSLINVFPERGKKHGKNKKVNITSEPQKNSILFVIFN